MTQIIATSAPRAAAADSKAVTLQFDDNVLLALLLGDHDRHLVRLQQGLGVRLSCRGNRVAIAGDVGRVELAQTALTEARSNLAQAQYDYAVAVAGLRHAMGTTE